MRLRGDWGGGRVTSRFDIFIEMESDESGTGQGGGGWEAGGRGSLPFSPFLISFSLFVSPMDAAKIGENELTEAAQTPENNGRRQLEEDKDQRAFSLLHSSSSFSSSSSSSSDPAPALLHPFPTLALPFPSPSSHSHACIFEYRGERVAGFEIGSAHQQILCLPQAYELFLKQFVGGLHTVYTKLKRLGIHPLVCSVEQVRALRSLGAIQPSVNRCKLIDTNDFDTLYWDCTNIGNRPGRPPKRTASGNIVEETDKRKPAKQSQLVEQQQLRGNSSETSSAGDLFVGLPLALPLSLSSSSASLFLPHSLSEAGGRGPEEELFEQTRQWLISLHHAAEAMAVTKQQADEEDEGEGQGGGNGGGGGGKEGMKNGGGGAKEARMEDREQSMEGAGRGNGTDSTSSSGAEGGMREREQGEQQLSVSPSMPMSSSSAATSQDSSSFFTNRSGTAGGESDGDGGGERKRKRGEKERKSAKWNKKKNKGAEEQGAELHAVLSRLEEVLDKMDSVLRGHCEQLAALTNSLQNELQKQAKFGQNQASLAGRDGGRRMEGGGTTAAAATIRTKYWRKQRHRALRHQQQKIKEPQMGQKLPAGATAND